MTVRPRGPEARPLHGNKAQVNWKEVWMEIAVAAVAGSQRGKQWRQWEWMEWSFTRAWPVRVYINSE